MSDQIGTYGSWRLRYMLWWNACVWVIFVMEFFEFYVIMSLREIFKWNCGTHIIQILKKLKE